MENVSPLASDNAIELLDRALVLLDEMGASLPAAFVAQAIAALAPVDTAILDIEKRSTRT